MAGSRSNLRADFLLAFLRLEVVSVASEPVNEVVVRVLHVGYFIAFPQSLEILHLASLSVALELWV